MSLPTITPQQIRTTLLARDEIALLDVRHEAQFATGHPLFAANMAANRIALEAELRLPRKDAPIVMYDDDDGFVPAAAEAFARLGYSNIRALAGGLQAWRDAGYELFIDVNSYAKAFGELVEERRHTPSLAADDVAALIESGANIKILDVRRFDEYTTMNIPGSVSVPGAELVLRAGHAAPDPATTIVVNCAGRTRSIIGTQSLINAGVPNKVVALRNGTMGWSAGKPHARSWRDKARRNRHVRESRDQRARRRLSRRRAPPHAGRSRRAAGADLAHALSFRRARRGGIQRRSPQRLPPLSRRPAGAGDRHGCTGARRAHRAHGRSGHPRRHDGVMAGADGVGRLRAGRRLQRRARIRSAPSAAESRSRASLSQAL